MLADHTTLARFLIEERRHRPDTDDELDSLVLEIALACKTVADRVALGPLAGAPGRTDRTGARDGVRRGLDLIAGDHFLRACERSGTLTGMVTGGLGEPHVPPAPYPRGRYLLVFDPLDGASDIDVNVSVGSIFSVLRAPEPGGAATAPDFLRPGTEQVCAGYALYGPSTVLVLTTGRGVHAFTLDPALGEFVLTREQVRIAPHATEFAIDASNRRFWEPAVRRYVDECLTGRSGPRHRDFTMRWVASLVAETHRIFTRGGVFLCPRDATAPERPGRRLLLEEANPVAFLVEQAGGAASTGRRRVLDLVPGDLRERVPLIFGARDEVELIDRYHREHNDGPPRSPLYGDRGLFRAEAG